MGRLLKVPDSLTPLAELAILDGREPTSSEWKTWVLESEAIWVEKPGSSAIQVPAKFMTDFASIPWLFRWWQTGSVGPQRVAAYFHDWLYSSQSSFSRKHSDQVFREVMKELGSKWLNYNAMYCALRVGGWMAWRSNQKKYKELGPYWRQLN
jgi:hypothetical protein